MTAQAGAATSSPLPDPVAAVLGGLPGLAANQAAGGGSALDAIGAVGGFLSWLTDPHNIVRVVFVLGGLAGVVVGLRIVADSGVGGAVGAAASGVKRASDAAGAGAKLAGQAGAAVATDGASLVATGAAKAGKAASTAGKAAAGAVKA